MTPDQTAFQVATTVRCDDALCVEKLARISAMLGGRDDLSNPLVHFDVEYELLEVSALAHGADERAAKQLLLGSIEAALATLREAMETLKAAAAKTGADAEGARLARLVAKHHHAIEQAARRCP